MKLGFAALMMLLAPQQAFSQIWEGGCDEIPHSLHDDVTAGLFGTWAADLSVTDPAAPCRFKGESVWTLYDYDWLNNANSVRGERRMSVERVRPSGCQRAVRNSVVAEVVTDRDADGRCYVRARLLSRYAGGQEVRAEISSMSPDSLVVRAQDGRSVTYRRRPRIRSSSTGDPAEDMFWRRSCGEDGDPIHNLAIEPAIHRQGATLSLKPTVRAPGPGGTYRLPGACVSGWSVSDASAASLDPAKGTLAIAADAPPGTEIAISYRVGERPVSARIKVVAADALVLTGRRGQRAVEGCTTTDEPVRELVFTEDGRFSVTFVPFETYTDYWGRYRFDPASGSLTLTVEGGNYQPPFLDLDGTARFQEGSLVLEDFYLGGRRGFVPPADSGRHSSCRYRF